MNAKDNALLKKLVKIHAECDLKTYREVLRETILKLTENFLNRNVHPVKKEERILSYVDHHYCEKIPAIKYVKNELDYGLLQAKQFVEQLHQFGGDKRYT